MRATMTTTTTKKRNELSKMNYELRISKLAAANVAIKK
jgi:hypothetical protein